MSRKGVWKRKLSSEKPDTTTQDCKFVFEYYTLLLLEKPGGAEGWFGRVCWYCRFMTVGTFFNNSFESLCISICGDEQTTSLFLFVQFPSKRNEQQQKRLAQGSRIKALCCAVSCPVYVGHFPLPCMFETR